MTNAYKATVTCRGCSTPAQVAVYQSVTAWLEPRLAEDVMNNKVNRLDCPSCGKVAFIDSELLFNDAAHGFLVQFVTSRTVQLAQLEEDLRHAVKEEPHLKARMVINRQAFLEKVRVFRAALDDIAIEVLKLLLKPQLPPALRDAELRFDKVTESPQGPKLSFTASGPDVATQMVSIPRSSHDSTAAKYGEESLRSSEIFVDDRLANRLIGLRR